MNNTNKSYSNMNGISNSSMIGMGTSHMNKTSTLGNINNMREFKNQNQQNSNFSTKNATNNENMPGMMVNNRSYSVNRALKDITTNVLN